VGDTVLYGVAYVTRAADERNEAVVERCWRRAGSIEAWPSPSPAGLASDAEIGHAGRRQLEQDVQRVVIRSPVRNSRSARGSAPHRVSTTRVKDKLTTTYAYLMYI